MFDFMKKMFGGSDAADGKRERKLRHPRDLRPGDIIKFSFMDNQDLSGRQFEVTQINSYLYDGLHYPELILKDTQGNIVYLMMEEEDGEECVSISKKIARSQIRKVIEQDDLDKVLKKGTGASIDVASVPEGLDQWLASTYTETEEATGFFVKGDTRDPNHSGGGREKFKSYTLIDDSDEYALEIEVYGKEELEMCATVYLEVGDIDEMWPGNGPS